MPGESDINLFGDSLELLELPSILEETAAHAYSAPGRVKVLDSAPLTEMAEIQAQLQLVCQLKEVASIGGPLGLGDLLPMEGTFEKLNNPISVLESEEILAVADLLSIVTGVRDRIERLEQRLNLVRDIGSRLITLGGLRHRIGQVLDEHGLVRSSASHRLEQIRARWRAARNRVRKMLEGIVQTRDLSRVVQEDYVTLRNDRYVILLRPEFKGVLDGIVHDHSRSGASVYVEPLEVLELNNQVASLLDEERDEVRRIFTELTAEIRSSIEEISTDYEILTTLDAFQARALYATTTDSVSPEMAEDGFAILGARHPLLLSAGVDVVPMDVIQDPLTLATVISGPNMGGKTVALKIAGLFPLMTRCGIMVPAREGTKISPFTRIMADIGDEQDIQSRVSSFSGHMLRIKSILETASAGDLVLLDELGGATDPEEGAALAMAILDEMIRRRARTVVTTHLTHLKAYGLGRTQVKNVSAEFHPETLEPTFKLLYDLPGESHAIAAAERIGLPESVIEAAKTYVDKAAGGSSRLMQSLREKLSEIDELRQDLSKQRLQLKEELDQIRVRKEVAIEEVRRKALDVVRKAEKEIGDLQRSLKSGRMKPGGEPRREVVRIKNELEIGLGTPLETRLPIPPVGSKVRLTTLDKEGTVLSILDKGQVEISVGKVKIRADVGDLVVLNESLPEKNASKKEQIGVHIPLATARREVNVIGLRVDEALPIVDRAVDEAVRSALSSLNIIHGKGTGRLKEGIRKYLAGHPLVKSLQSGDLVQGGEGVTVVVLAED